MHSATTLNTSIRLPPSNTSIRLINSKLYLIFSIDALTYDMLSMKKCSISYYPVPFPANSAAVNVIPSKSCLTSDEILFYSICLVIP